MDGDSAVRVIKEQRVRSTILWTEKEISAGQSKVRIGLLDKGTSFMDIDTPRKVLYALYDLLEGEPRRTPALTRTSSHI